MKTLVGIYDNLALAEGALRSLLASGIRRDHMNLIGSVVDEDVRPYFDEEGRLREDWRREDRDRRDSRRGSVLAVGNILATMGLLSIPALGPLLAAGPMLSGLVGAGAVAGADLERLFADVGIPSEEIPHYTEALRRGLVVLLVSAEPGDVDNVAGVMAMYGPIDLDRLASRWERERAHEHEMVAAVDAEAETSGIYGGPTERRA